MPIWRSDLAVGVPEIDAQHQELFARANAVLEAIAPDASPREIRRLLDFLGTYCDDHFGSEERLMRRVRYPGVEQHVLEHAVFVLRFRAIEEELDAHGPSEQLAASLQRLISGWLVQHIAAVDGRLAGFLGTTAGPAQGS